MQALDVGIIPFRANDPHVQGINPNKVYQYLASGIPVVMDEHVVQCATSYRNVARCAERRDHRIGERRIIRWKQAEGVADCVVDGAAGSGSMLPSWRTRQ
jgi:hypothetical protein